MIDELIWYYVVHFCQLSLTRNIHSSSKRIIIFNNTLNFRTQYAGKRVFVSLSPGPAYKLPHLDFSPFPFHFQHGLTHTESFILVYGLDKKLSNNWSSFSFFSGGNSNEIEVRKLGDFSLGCFFPVNSTRLDSMKGHQNISAWLSIFDSGNHE